MADYIERIRDRFSKAKEHARAYPFLWGSYGFTAVTLAVSGVVMFRRMRGAERGLIEAHAAAQRRYAERLAQAELSAASSTRATETVNK
eukprot:EC716681.1.p1 GENE.EC716681.1~~EC716681.1.p1  ORF type:complete len:89 (+),score=0.29 EC716681.1:93-359(+)